MYLYFTYFSCFRLCILQLKLETHGCKLNFLINESEYSLSSQRLAVIKAL